MTAPPLEGKDLQILVVDDYTLTRDMVRSILKGLGFSNILTAENGSSALKVLADHDVDLIICDWNMPSLSGLELLKEIRKQKQYQETPFLMLTAEAYRENVVEAMSAGVTDYIAKPFTAGVLSAKIQLALAKK